jgi:predicted amidohydrolase YtcJ
MAAEHGFQLCTHAIGDRANREVLNIYEETLSSAGRIDEARWRIEHAQHIDPDDIPRFGRLGVIASMQGVHCTSDGPWVPRRIGDKRASDGAYPWRNLLQDGATIANGTDAPVESIDPLACFHASVTRQLGDGTRFYPDQCMTRDEALRSYTINGAYAAFEEGLKGSITPGKLADITVLSHDILTIPEDSLPTTRVDLTIVGGRIRYARR